MMSTKATAAGGKPSTPPEVANGRVRRLRRLRVLTRVGQAVAVIAVFVAVWFVAFSDDGTAPVLPDTEQQFSLDLKVLDPIDHDIVYAVEQRARPAYRIFSFDPASGAEETLFTVPEDAIIYGIALSPDDSKIAVGYTTDFSVDGNGIWMLDLDSLAFDEVIPVEPDVFLTDIAWSGDGESLLVTHVDRRGEEEELAVAELDLATAAVDILASDAINPAVVGDEVYYLTVDETKARRSIGKLSDGSTAAFEGSTLDLDHLVAGSGDNPLHVAVIESSETSDGTELSFGAPAWAHGNHNVASTWWSVDLAAGADSPETGAATDVEPIIVYSSSATDESVVYATLEGLSIAQFDEDGYSSERIDLIKSRAIRFVTG